MSEQESYVEDHFGNCPECGRTNGCLNVFKDHYFRCDEHKTVWFVGANLSSSWRHETHEDWERNDAFLHGYKIAPFEYVVFSEREEKEEPLSDEEWVAEP